MRGLEFLLSTITKSNGMYSQKVTQDPQHLCPQQKGQSYSQQPYTEKSRRAIRIFTSTISTSIDYTTCRVVSLDKPKNFLYDLELFCQSKQLGLCYYIHHMFLHIFLRKHHRERQKDKWKQVKPGNTYLLPKMTLKEITHTVVKKMAIKCQNLELQLQCKIASMNTKRKGKRNYL